MTQVSFSGSGTDSLDNQVGKGKGLQIGNTKIDFASGKIQLNDGETIGNFRTLKKQGAQSNEIKTFAFKAKTKCTIKFQNTFLEYSLINEWIILQGIQTEEITLSRPATGLTVDIFDFTFIGSDDPKYKLSIEKGTRDSDVETLLASSSRSVDTYTQTFNVQGAKKIILTGKAIAGAGQADISLEIIDPASGSWVPHIPKEIIFSLTNGDLKRAQIGEGISYVPKDEDLKFIEYDLSGAGNPSILTDVESRAQATIRHFAPYGTFIGFVLPSGDNLIRLKAVVTVDSLTFGVGIIKVFN